MASELLIAALPRMVATARLLPQLTCPPSRASGDTAAVGMEPLGPVRRCSQQALLAESEKTGHDGRNGGRQQEGGGGGRHGSAARCPRLEPADMGADCADPFGTGLPSGVPAHRQPAGRRGSDTGSLRPRLPFAVPVHTRHFRRLASPDHTSELQSPVHLVCRLLLEKKKKKKTI